MIDERTKSHRHAGNMVRLLLTIYTMLLWTCICYSQKEDYNWLFGTYGRGEWWTGVNTFQFTDSSLVITRLPELIHGHYTAVSAISDAQGQLVLSTNGMQIRNGQMDTIVGGGKVNYNQFWEKFHFINEHFDITVGLNLSQGTLLLKWPGRDSVICLTSNWLNIDGVTDYCRGLFLNIIDTQNEPYRVVEKDHLFFTDSLSVGTLQACRHANGRDWWIVAPGYFHNKFYVFLLDPSGIQLHHTEWVERYYEHAVGQAWFSPDGSKYVLIDVPDRIAILDQGHLTVFDFDRNSGLLSNLRKEDFKGLTNAVGCAISYDSRYLYTGNATDLHQYDLKANNILATKKLIAKSDGFLSVYGPNATKKNDFGFFQLAPDGKIYGPGGLTLHMHRIDYPDEAGTSAQVSQHAIETSDNDNTITNMPNYRLGPLDGSPADTLGLDNHPVAKFRFEADTANHLRVRFTDLSYFRPESWRWRFGDGKSWNGKRPLWHTFPENGSYKVCLTVCNENSCDTLCRWLTLGPNAIQDGEMISRSTAVYPNPTNGPLFVTIQDYIPENAIIYLYDIMGKQVYQQRVFNDWNSLDITSLPAGQYLYLVKDREKITGRGKVIKM